MHDLLIALAYIGALVLPIVATARQAHDLEDDHIEP